MLRRTALALILALPLVASADDATVYGAGVQEAKAVRVSELLENPAAYVGKKVRVEGLVTDVCPKRGCWLKVAGDNEFQTLTFKVKDGTMVFPLSAKGHKANVEGIFTKLDLTPEQAVARARHEAEEKGQSFDPSTVKGPQVMYRIDGTGAVIR